jgi:hypothetical protein
MRYRLRTLLIVLALGPPLIALATYFLGLPVIGQLAEPMLLIGLLASAYLVNRTIMTNA